MKSLKRGLCFVLTFFFLLAGSVPMKVSAAAGAQLAVQGRNVTITLQKPQGVTGRVTSIRFWMYTAVTEGEMEPPVFQFTDTASGGAPGAVKDAAVTKQGSRYIIDVIVSVKKDQDIFQGASSVVIGTLVMNPASQKVQAEIGAAAQSADAQPVLKYISAENPQEQAAFLSDVQPAGYSGSISDIPVTPQVPADPGGEAFQNAAPVLKLRADTTRKISFSWKQITGADGYKIYQYQEDTGKYKRIKTISKGDKITYSKKMEFGTAYKFRMRAFQIQPDGTKTYGTYSAIKQISTPPAKVKGLAVKNNRSAKPVLIWNQLEQSEGYQVFQSTDKTGTYTRIKTIKKEDVCKYALKNQPEGRRYYKVRAYVTKADGKRKYGAFSSIKAAVKW